MRDKRSFERYDINVPVRVEIKDPDGLPEKIDFESINLAAGGVLLKRSISLPENATIRLEIIFYFEDLKYRENDEGAPIMTVTGYVVRNEPEGIAIRFNDDYEMSPCLKPAFCATGGLLSCEQKSNL